MAATPAAAAQKSVGEVLKVLFTDPEAALWVVISSLRDISSLQGMSDVNTLFLRDHWHQDAAGMARWQSLNALSGIIGGAISGPLVRLVGSKLQFTLSNFGTCVGFALWGRARTLP